MSTLTSLAERYCDQHHIDQVRESTGAPYSVHPRAVAKYLEEHGYADEITQCIALMHDLKEDTPLLINDIQARFGFEIANGVYVLSRNTIDEKELQRMALTDPALLTMERKQAIDLAYKRRLTNARRKVIAVKIGDMWDNTNDLAAMPEKPRERKIREAIEFYIPLGRFTDVILTQGLENNVRNYLSARNRDVPPVLMEHDVLLKAHL